MVESGSKVSNAAKGSRMFFPSRVVIEHVYPEVDAGKFPAKRVLGETVRVSANIHTDGHNALKALLLYRHSTDKKWHEVEMMSAGAGLDLYVEEFEVDRLGTYEYTLKAWIDNFGNWRRATAKKIAAGQDVSVEIVEGEKIFHSAIAKASGAEQNELKRFATMLNQSVMTQHSPLFIDRGLEELMLKYADRGRIAEYERVLEVMVEPEYALYSSWYELFPRSCTDDVNRHGTFKDVINTLPYVQDMGFDVLYLPPIHPIGVTKRKGKNNSLTAGPNDPGSPWAIGGAEGGHRSVHPQLGTLADFDALVKAAAERGLRIALDIAFQCSPDHPYVKEHPEWFYHRPDGSIKYAENPPKKYEDIYPLDFEGEHWEALWEELTDVVRFWVARGVYIFRIDNPHTKPYLFWKYLISEIKRDAPQTIFLSEAFARPKVMMQLAKCGFSQSYTYFTWRTSKWELTDYMNELTKSEVVEYFRPNFFANTPDILPDNLQHGGRNSFLIRVTLAATLSAAYGIYGPAYELCDDVAIAGKEEYFNSEKYEIKNWNLEDPVSIREYIKRLNEIRAEHSALHNNRSLRFLDINNKDMIAFCKMDPHEQDLIVVVVNLDPYNPQSGHLNLPLHEFGIENYFQVHDLITNRRYNWAGENNLVALSPGVPAYIFRLRKRLRREQDFDYFM
jgi:starch synthase (maltosyl-transferring)